MIQFREETVLLPVTQREVEDPAVGGADVGSNVSASSALGTPIDHVAGIVVHTGIDGIVAVECGELVVQGENVILRQPGGDLGIRQRLHTEGMRGKSAALAKITDERKHQEGLSGCA